MKRFSALHITTQRYVLLPSVVGGGVFFEKGSKKGQLGLFKSLLYPDSKNMTPHERWPASAEGNDIIPSELGLVFFKSF